MSAAATSALLVSSRLDFSLNGSCRAQQCDYYGLSSSMLTRQFYPPSYLNQSLSWRLPCQIQQRKRPGSEQLFRAGASGPSVAELVRITPQASLWLHTGRPRHEISASLRENGNQIRLKEKHVGLLGEFVRSRDQDARRKRNAPATTRRPQTLVHHVRVHKPEIPPSRRSVDFQSWSTAIYFLKERYPIYGSGLPKSVCRVQSSDKGDVQGVWFAEKIFVQPCTWKGKMLCDLYTDPKEALRTLDANLLDSTSLPLRYNVLDCLVVISCAFLLHSDTSALGQKFDIDVLFRCVHNFLTKYSHRLYRRQSRRDFELVIKLLSKHCSYEKLVQLCSTITAHELWVTPRTKQFLAELFVDHGDVSNALRVFRLIPLTHLQNSMRQYFCVKLLRLKFEVENLHATRSAILTEMLERGVRPNRFMVNVIMTNAVEGEDYAAVWNVHNLTAENGMKPDDITYDILFRAARDMDTVEHIRKEATEDGIFPLVPRLIATYLRTVFKLARGDGSDSELFDLLLPRYRDFLDLRPLQDLLGVGQHQVESSRDLEVNHMALGTMIMAYLRQNRYSWGMNHIYQNFMRLVKTGHPVWLELAKSAHTHNAFIWVFGQRTDTVHMGISVIEDMIKYSDRLGITQPNAHSWNILLTNFLFHGQTAAAERVLSIMKLRGIEAQQMTWSEIVAAYAKLQDVGAAVDALLRMEKEGLPVDDRTIKALGLIHDRDRLRRALESISQTQTADKEGPVLLSPDTLNVHSVGGMV